MQTKKLNNFLTWVDKCTHFFTDKDITINQVVDEYVKQFPEPDYGMFGGEQKFKKDINDGKYAIPPVGDGLMSQTQLNENKRFMVCSYHTSQLFETEVMPKKDGWYICYVAGERLMLNWSITYQRWSNIVGRSYQLNQIEKWLNDK